MSDRNLPDEENPDPVGAELRRLFDVEKEELPPFFSETLHLSRGVDEEIAGYQGLEEQALRRFFARIGRDYDAWYRTRQQRRRRRFVVRVCMGVLLLACLGLLLGGMLVLWPQPLEALRQPLIRWFSGQPTPVPAGQIISYDNVAALQPYFSIALPQQPPAGLRVVSTELNLASPAGPRSMISYRREAEDPDQHGDTVVLLIWSLADEPFPFPANAVAEPIVMAGQPAQWVRIGPQGGWVLWEQGQYKLALFSGRLSRTQLIRMAEDFYRQSGGR